MSNTLRSVTVTMVVEVDGRPYHLRIESGTPLSLRDQNGLSLFLQKVNEEIGGVLVQDFDSICELEEALRFSGYIPQRTH